MQQAMILMKPLSPTVIVRLVSMVAERYTSIDLLFRM